MAIAPRELYKTFASALFSRLTLDIFYLALLFSNYAINLINWPLKISLLTAVVLGIAGPTLNLIVMLANEGAMPVDLSDYSPEEVIGHKVEMSIDGNHCVADRETRLRFLIDRFNFREKSITARLIFGAYHSQANIYSLGDILLFSGIRLERLILWLIIAYLIIK
jgi:hypothetical protein